MIVQVFGPAVADTRRLTRGTSCCSAHAHCLPADQVLPLTTATVTSVAPHTVPANQTPVPLTTTSVSVLHFRVAWLSGSPDVPFFTPLLQITISETHSYGPGYVLVYSNGRSLGLVPVCGAANLDKNGERQNPNGRFCVETGVDKRTVAQF